MSFLGVYRAIYAYAPQSDQELELSEGDLLYVLEKSTDDDWWKAKKKAGANEDDEPIGLIPNNYIEEADPIGKLRALYDYQRQTEEELSFSEDALLDVYDSSDPDWCLVGLNGEYGFAPSNYLEEGADAPAEAASPPAPQPPAMPPRPTAVPEEEEEEEEEVESPVRASPAAAVAEILQARQAQAAQTRYTPPPPQPTKAVHFTPEASDEEDEAPPPRLPTRPRGTSETSSSYASPISPPPATTFEEIEAAGVHRYPVDEIVSKKKNPAILELGNGKITLRPNKKHAPATSWDIEDLQTYSGDGRRVGLDLVSPIRSLDLRTESKEIASEILHDLGEMKGASRAVGLKEVMVAATSGGKKIGIVLYDFDTQADDEVSVSVGDEVVILDDTKSDEWWQVRRTSNGKEGVVPSSYIEIKKPQLYEPDRPEPTRESSSARARSASGTEYGHNHSDSVGPGINLPKRGSSLATSTTVATGSHSRRKESSSSKPTSSKPKPNPLKIRTWTDRSGTFKVDAEFLNIRDGVIHLHKVNGVKIAVPIAKMSKVDLEFVERHTGISLDEDKPLSDLRGKQRQNAATSSSGTPTSSSGLTIDRSKAPPAANGAKKEEYDWFDFFLACGVDVHACQRYANNFVRDNMDEAILPEITPPVLRTLGLKEGDILRVMKHLDSKYGRKKEGSSEDGGSKNLFTNPDGGLKNNTGRTRPAPGTRAPDTVDANAFDQRKDSPPPTESRSQDPKKSSGKDEAWIPKPSKQESTSPPKSTSPAPQTAAPPPQAQPEPKPPAPPTGALRELSILDEPLQPTVLHQAPQPSTEKIVTPPPQPSSAPPQQTWQPPPPNVLAAPLSVFQQAPQQQQANPTSPPVPFINYQQTGILQPQQNVQGLQFAQNPLQQQATARQRPAPPQMVQAGGLVPPPPQRPQSAPGQQFQQNQLPIISPLAPALTGYQSQPSLAPQGQLSIGQLQQQQQAAEYQRQLQVQALAQQQALQPQLTAVPNGGFNAFPAPNPQLQFPSLQVQATGYVQQPQFGNPLAVQPTGSVLGAPLRAPFTPTVDLSLPTPLIPQNTAMPLPQNGLQPGGINKGLIPPLQPLKPQATGPAPQVKFGVTPGKLAPQPTGIRKANLNAATPDNPFGF